MKKLNLVFFSYIAAPHQIKLCNALQKYFNAEFYFYDSVGERASWWKIDLGEKCHILKNVLFKKSCRYLTYSVINVLRKSKVDIDIVMLGGFSVPSNYIAYRWARFNNMKTIVFTERARNTEGELASWGLKWKLIRFLYRKVDMVMVSATDILPQFRDELRFGDKVVVSRYASDIDNYFSHDFRIHKKGYAYLFANRLTSIYDPIKAIQIFNKILSTYPDSKLRMNAKGELREDCEKLINKLGLSNAVDFIDRIKSWDDLHAEYAKCDILLFPAKFSNGNFTIIEAMASGMGIVISDKILGVGKMIQNNKNGFRCPPTEHDFLSSIKMYIDHPDLFQHHATINRKIVSPLGVEGTAQLYYSIITNKFLQ